MVLIEKFVFNVAYEKIGVAESNFGTHGLKERGVPPLPCGNSRDSKIKLRVECQHWFSRAE